MPGGNRLAESMNSAVMMDLLTLTSAAYVSGRRTQVRNLECQRVVQVHGEVPTGIGAPAKVDVQCQLQENVLENCS